MLGLPQFSTYNVDFFLLKMIILAYIVLYDAHNFQKFVSFFFS